MKFAKRISVSSQATFVSWGATCWVCSWIIRTWIPNRTCSLSKIRVDWYLGLWQNENQFMDSESNSTRIHWRTITKYWGLRIRFWLQITVWKSEPSIPTCFCKRTKTRRILSRLKWQSNIGKSSAASFSCMTKLTHLKSMVHLSHSFSHQLVSPFSLCICSHWLFFWTKCRFQRIQSTPKSKSYGRVNSKSFRSVLIHTCQHTAKLAIYWADSSWLERV